LGFLIWPFKFLATTTKEGLSQTNVYDVAVGINAVPEIIIM